MPALMQFGASRLYDYPEDKGALSVQEWTDRNNPIESARLQIRTLATQGNPLAARIVQIFDAKAEKKRAEAQGIEAPAWAREALSFLDEYQDGNLDEALAALKAAVK